MKSRFIFFAYCKWLPRWNHATVSTSCSHRDFSTSQFLGNNPKHIKISYRTLRSCANQDRTDDLCTENVRKILKIAIIGVPNVGKSTLINQIVGRHVFAVSSKVHTTRCCARAVAVIGNTQLVFLDTPGLVSVQESVKHHLDRQFLVDSAESVREADIIGVVHDSANTYTRLQLDEKVLRLLFTYPKKNAFLVLNKVDAIEKKRNLLDCVDSLTKGRRILEEDVVPIDDNGVARFSETDLQILTGGQTGWPYFTDVFMVSALHGDGVGDIQMKLLQSAKPGDWLFTDGSLVTDQSDEEIINNTVFAKLLDHLPNVIPYNLKVQLEYFHRAEEGTVTAIVLVIAKKTKIKELIIGQGGGRIKKIAADVEQNLRQFFLNDVHVRLVLREEEISPDNKDKSEPKTDQKLKTNRAQRRKKDLA